MSPPVIALTSGDPAGVGPEIAVRALAEPAVRATMVPVLIGDRAVVEEVVAGCGLPLEVRTIGHPGEASGDSGAVELIDLGLVTDPVEFGAVNANYGAAAAEYIARATSLAADGAVAGLVTGPINKESLRASGSPYPGHTEMLAAHFGVPIHEVFTMFTVERLRIFFLTRHHSLIDAIGLLNEEMVHLALVRVKQLMIEIGRPEPRVALAALNPHAGEHGLMGTEEDEFLTPAVQRARADGVDAYGPVPADTVFSHCRAGRYDCVLSLYHDQGHIAAKTLDFFGTVSSTLGLPVIRTAAEHGTAFDIAGSWEANPGGQVAAMLEAADVAAAVTNR